MSCFRYHLGVTYHLREISLYVPFAHLRTYRLLHANPFHTCPHHFPKWISQEASLLVWTSSLQGENCYGQRKHHLKQLPGDKTRRRKKRSGVNPFVHVHFMTLKWTWHEMEYLKIKSMLMLMWFPIWPPCGFSCLYLKKTPTSHPRFRSPVNVGFLDLFQET